MALVLLGYLLIWRPVNEDNAHLRERLEQSRTLASWMAAASAEAQRLQARSPRRETGRSVQQEVAEAAARLELPLERLETGSTGEARLWLDAVPFEELMTLVQQLSRQGLALRSATLRRSQEPGRVGARLRFARSG